MANKGPSLYDYSMWLNMGKDPITGKPIRGAGTKGALKDNIKIQLQGIDKEDHNNRGIWKNLPCNLTSQDVERMLYYKGQLAFFYNKDLDEFFLLPYAMNSKDGCGLDAYGRITQIKPIAYVGGSTEETKSKTPLANYFDELSLDVAYVPQYYDDLSDLNDDEFNQFMELANESGDDSVKHYYDEIKRHNKDRENAAVILQDYSPQFNYNNVIPRSQLQDGLLSLMAECPCYARTSAILGSGISGMRINDASQISDVLSTSMSMQDSALNGLGYVPLVASIELQELTGAGKMNNVDQYFQMMQSLDNFRLSCYGIDNGGLFEKKAHMLQSEADLNGGPVGLVLQDAITIRQNFCRIVNSIWPELNIWYEPSETISKADINGDGVLYDRNTDDQPDYANSNNQGGNDDN